MLVADNVRVGVHQCEPKALPDASQLILEFFYLSSLIWALSLSLLLLLLLVLLLVLGFYLPSLFLECSE